MLSNLFEPARPGCLPRVFRPGPLFQPMGSVQNRCHLLGDLSGSKQNAFETFRTGSTGMPPKGVPAGATFSADGFCSKPMSFFRWLVGVQTECFRDFSNRLDREASQGCSGPGHFFSRWVLFKTDTNFKRPARSPTRMLSNLFEPARQRCFPGVFRPGSLFETHALWSKPKWVTLCRLVDFNDLLELILFLTRISMEAIPKVGTLGPRLHGKSRNSFLDWLNRSYSFSLPGS